MNLLLLLVLDSWQIAYGQGLLERLHTYDLVRYEVVVEPLERGARIDCRLTLEVEKPGPLRFFLSPEVEGLHVERDGKPVAASLGEGGFAKLLGLLARSVQGVPDLLTLPAAPVGKQATFRLTYLWKPSGKGLAYAAQKNVQTHLASFWLPTMADEFFEASIKVKGDRPFVVSAPRTPLQVLCLVAGDFRVHRRDGLELYLPRDVEADPKRILEDLAAVLAQLQQWFGPARGDGFRLVVESRKRRTPSYCAGSFAVLDRFALQLPRPNWLAHLAHECAHLWWGHKVGSPVVGGGGTWLREGLAEWSGIKVAGALLGAQAERRLFRARFRAYFGRIDLRHRGSSAVVFANEPTLLDATYLDDLAVPYLRGALVHRLIEQRRGPAVFRALLERFARRQTHRFARASDYARAVRSAAEVAYYAGTSRLPDFAIGKPKGRSVSLRCLDPEWPGGRVPCRVDDRTVLVSIRDGRGTLSWSGATPARIEIDPERIFLDPVRSNNIWTRR